MWSQLPQSVLAKQQRNHLKIQVCLPVLVLLSKKGKTRIFTSGQLLLLIIIRLSDLFAVLIWSPYSVDSQLILLVLSTFH